MCLQGGDTPEPAVDLALYVALHLVARVLQCLLVGLLAEHLDHTPLNLLDYPITILPFPTCHQSNDSGHQKDIFDLCNFRHHNLLPP